MSYLHKLWRELEGTGLEPQILGRGREYEPVVDVDEVALAVEQDVAVVPVLDLHQVGHDAVGGAALHELALGRQEALGVDVAELLPAE